MIGHHTFSDIAKQMQYVYFAQMPAGGPIKIGCARNLAQRLIGLQGEFSVPLAFAASVPGRRCDETMLHRIFAADRIVGEWFHPSIHLVAFVEMVSKIGEIPEPYRWSSPLEVKRKARAPYRIKEGGKPKMKATLAAKYAVIIPQRAQARVQLRQSLLQMAAVV